MRCLRQIAHINGKTRSQIQKSCRDAKIPASKRSMLTTQLQWTEHVVRMDNSRLPRIIFYGQLQQGERSRGGERKPYKDALKANLTMLYINTAHLESLDSRQDVVTCFMSSINRHFRAPLHQSHQEQEQTT